MKTLILTISTLAFACVIALGQARKSVVIGSMIDRPNAVLVINPPNGNQGFLLPQLTTTQRLSIAPASPNDDGLMVYDLTEKTFYYWNNSTWVKGLGDNQTIGYDPATQRLSLSDGGQADLSTLKEIPVQAGNTGKFLTTNGTTLSWATIGALGDITSIVTNTTSGLSGGATSGDVALSVNTDGTTISVNGTNQLQLSNAAVTTAKLAPNAVNATHIIDGSVTGTDIQDNSISTNDLANGAVTSVKIGAGQVETININSGGNDKVLTTNAVGVVAWADRSTFTDDNQNLSLTGNTLNIDNGAAVNLNAVAAAGEVAGPLNATVIQANTINSAKIADGTVATADIATGGNNKVMTTDATGVVSWSDQTAFTDDNQNLSLTGNTLNIDDGTAVNLNALAATGEVAGPLNATVIQPNTINSAKIADGTVATADIATGGNNKIMTTDATGVVSWADQTAFTDDNQTLTFTGNTLTIQDGNAVNLAAAGQVNGLLDNLVIQQGTANQVLVTNGAGTASQWTTPAGDVTGALNASTVGRIQGRDVTNTAPATGDALTWNGTAWAPAPVVVAPAVQFYAVDPSNFIALEPGGNNASILGIFEDANSSFVFAKGGARQIMAPVNLPHGATIQSITVYYECVLGLPPVTVELNRKTFSNAANLTLGNIATPLIALGIQSATAPAPAVVDNSTYSYRILVTFTNLLDVATPVLALQRIHGVRIQYTK